MCINKLIEFKNPKVSLLKDTTGVDGILSLDQLKTNQLLDDINLYLCSQIENIDNDIQVFKRIQSLFQMFSANICQEMYFQAINDLETYSNSEFSSKPYGLVKKAKLYIII